MKIAKSLTYLAPVLVAGLVSCGGPSEADIDAMVNEAMSDIENLETNIDDSETTTDTDADTNEMTSIGDNFTSGDGNFTIIFPGEPTASSQAVPTDVGDIQMSSYMYEKSSKEVYMVAYSDYPKKYVDGSNPEELLEGGKSGAMESLGILSTEIEEKIAIDGNPGLFFQANNGSYYVAYEMYLVDNRLYQIAILREGSYPPQSDIDLFTKTFALTTDGE